MDLLQAGLSQENPMSPSSSLHSVAEATRSFVARLVPAGAFRVEAKISSREGMPLLCAVEAVLAQTLPTQASQELVWLSGEASSGAHRLRLQAFGPGNELLAEAVHEFAA
jgi:hypothetical protein